MKKLIILLLTFAMVFSIVCSFADNETEDLIAAAQKEGKLIVYGSCDEYYLKTACAKFEDLYGIQVDYEYMSTGAVQNKIAEENGNPSADVWFGGTNEPYNEAAKEGLLDAYEAQNAVHLIDPVFRDPDGYWYGIYQGILGFMVNKAKLSSMDLEVPHTWDDLLKDEYKGLIWLSNPHFAGTAKLFINTIIQLKKYDKAMEYFVALDKNIVKYTYNGSGPSKNVGTGDCVIGIGFLHDGLYQILQGFNDIGLIIPEDGTAYEIGSTAIFKGAAHPNAAKLWIEFALSPDCVELADDAGSYQYLVIDNAQMPTVLAGFSELDRKKTIDYDFSDAKENTSKYVDSFFKVLKDAGVDVDDVNRFEIE